MTEARLPTPRRIARTPVVRQPSGFSALGDALSTAGQALGEFDRADRATEERVAEIDHRIALDEQKRQDDALYIEKATEWIGLQAEAEARAAELRQEAGAFAHGHAEAMRQWMDDQFRAFDEGMAGNGRVRERMRLQLVQSAARIDLREQAWEREQGFKAQGESLEVATKTLRNQLARSKPETLGEDFARYAGQLDEMIAAGAFNEDQAATMRRAVMTELAQGMVDGNFNAGQPQAVQALVDQGFFDGLDVDVDKLGRQVKGEQRAMDIAAERARTEQQEAARDAIAAIEAEVKLGINPSAEQFAAAKALAQQAGLPQDEVIGLDGLSIQMGLNRRYGEAVDPEGIGAARAFEQLDRKVAAGTATKAEQVAHAHLAGVAETRAKAAGRKRKELAGQGVQGQMAVLADLDRMPATQRFTAAQEAMDGLGYVAGLRTRTRQFALEGREIRKARKKDFGTADDVQEAFRASVGDFAGTLGGSYDAMLDVAWDIYAGTYAAQGKDGWQPAGFARAVDLAFGMSRRADGTMQGGVGEYRGKRVVLPEWQTEAEFERTLGSLSFENARYAGGDPVNKADVLQHYRPEWYRDTSDGKPVYRMVDAQGFPLTDKDGGVWDFSVGRATPATPRAPRRDSPKDFPAMGAR